MAIFDEDERLFRDGFRLRYVSMGMTRDRRGLFEVRRNSGHERPQRGHLVRREIDGVAARRLWTTMPLSRVNPFPGQLPRF
jgi:hypothetical protein